MPVPRVIITDKLKSYGAAKREILPGVEPRQHRYLNNRAENSHQPTRQRERRMQGFKSPGHAQWFLKEYRTALLTPSGHWGQMPRQQAAGPVLKLRWTPLPGLP